MKKYAIIVAGGSGSRMKSNTPKQFMELEGKPLLMYTIEAFHSHDNQIHIIVVLPEEHQSSWKEYVQDFKFNIPHQTAIGGTTRFESVRNGLNNIDKEGLVAIHDGARPLVTENVIENTYHAAEHHGNGVAAVALKDSIRVVTTDGNEAVDRKNYYAIQTPQTFQTSIIKKAFEAATSSNFTDDASVAEMNGEKINLIEGSYENLKITTPEDLSIAQIILAKRK